MSGDNVIVGAVGPAAAEPLAEVKRRRNTGILGALGDGVGWLFGGGTSDTPYRDAEHGGRTHMRNGRHFDIDSTHVVTAIVAARVVTFESVGEEIAVVAAAALTVELAANAVSTLSRFMRCSKIASLHQYNMGAQADQRVTMATFADGINSSTETLNAAVSEFQPRVVMQPTRATMKLGRARFASCVPSAQVTTQGEVPPPGIENIEGAKDGSKGGSVFKRGPLFSLRSAWRDDLESKERAAEGLAQFVGVGTNGESDVAFLSGQTFFTRLLNRVFNNQKSYHRASNKFFKRLRQLRALREEMIFTGVGHKREKTPLNVAAAEELAKKIVSRAIDDGTILQSDARWFKNGLVETYFVKDDDDQFWAGLAAAPAAIRA